MQQKESGNAAVTYGTPCDGSVMGLHAWLYNVNYKYRIWGSHSGGYEEYYLLGYNAM
jgi:hypothetical protein